VLSLFNSRERTIMNDMKSTTETELKVRRQMKTLTKDDYYNLRVMTANYCYPKFFSHYKSNKIIKINLDAPPPPPSLSLNESRADLDYFIKVLFDLRTPNPDLNAYRDELFVDHYFNYSIDNLVAFIEKHSVVNKEAMMISMISYEKYVSLQKESA
jgi:hypothetical protein